MLRQSAAFQIELAAVGKLQIFYGVRVRIKLVTQIDALSFVVFDVNFQGMSRTLKRQIVKRDTFPENDFIRTAGLNDFVEPVAQIPNIGVVVVSAVQVIVARTADKRIISVPGVYQIISRTAVDHIVSGICADGVISAVAVNRVVEIRA